MIQLKEAVSSLSHKVPINDYILATKHLQISESTEDENHASSVQKAMEHRAKGVTRRRGKLDCLGTGIESIAQNSTVKQMWDSGRLKVTSCLLLASREQE